MSGGANHSGMLSGFPDSIRLKMRYTDTLEFSSTAGAAVQSQWRGNDIFDPFGSAGSAQPYAFDQWASFYTYYRVFASSIRITAMPTMSTVPVAGLTPDLFTARVAVYPAFQSATAIVPECFQFPRSRSAVSNGEAVVATLTNSIRTATVVGVPEVEVQTSTSYAAAVTASPVNLWYWNLAIAPTRDGHDQEWSAEVTIEYDTLFFGRRQLTDSLKLLAAVYQKESVKTRMALVAGKSSADKADSKDPHVDEKEECVLVRIPRKNYPTLTKEKEK